MKLYHIVILIFILSINQINGQVDNNIKLGLKVGANYTLPKIVDLKSMEFSDQFGMDFGIFTDFNFTNRFGLKLELLYSSQNFNMDYYEYYGFGNENGTYQLNTKIKDKYIFLPILLKLKLIEKLDILIGPQLGFLISDKNKFSVHDDRLHFSIEEIDFAEHFNIGGDFELSFRPSNDLNLGFRYSLGINKVNSFRNSGLQCYIGYAIL